MRTVIVSHATSTRRYTLRLNNKDIGRATVVCREKSSSLTWLYITEEYRSQGHGAYLLDRILEGIYDEMLLAVKSNNRHAISLYNSRGFRTYKTLNLTEQSDGEDVSYLLMRRCLVISGLN